MAEVLNDIHSDMNFLENEKFDFDLPFSPALPEDKVDDDGKVVDDDEVFFGPVGFTEQCMSTRVATIHDETTTIVTPLSPLSGEQVVELFTEATKIALHIESSLSTSETSLNQSHSSSERSSLSNYFKLSNCSTSSSDYHSSIGKSPSGGDSDANPSVLSSSDLVETGECKENNRPISKGEIKGGNEIEKKRTSSKIKVLAPKQLNTPVANVRKGFPRPGSGRGASKLPRSRNTEKTFSVFNSPIKAPDRQNGVVKNDKITSNNSQIKYPEKSIRRTSQRLTKSFASPQNNVASGKGTPFTTKDRTACSSNTLIKRNIFRYTESLNEGVANKDGRSKLPVPEQSKIPAPKSRRRRSSSTSSLSSQSSTSSSQAPPEEAHTGSIKPSRLTKLIPSTKASLASSLPLGLLRRSSKVHAQENTNDRRAQPIKALPRSTIPSCKNTDTPLCNLNPRDKVRRFSAVEVSNDKVPLAATPQPSVPTSLPVAKRRSSIRRPATTGRKDSASGAINTESSQRRRSGINSCGTPVRKDGKAPSNLTTRRARRSLLPTPVRTNSTKSRIPSDDPPMLPHSPAGIIKRENLNEKTEIVKVEDNLLIDTESPIRRSRIQSVDDLLQLDGTVSLMSGVMPIQPKPAVPQAADLIDLSGI